MSAEQFNIDYHRLLGVNRNADDQTILKAFRQLSRRYHPDKVSGQEDMMKLLTMAKITLLDPDKRAKYDANYEFGDNQPDLTADLQRLNIGHRLSDDYRAKIEQWKNEYPNIRITDNMNVFDQLFQQFKQSMLNNRTVFDLGTDHLINQNKSKKIMLEELRIIFNAVDFGNLAQYIMTHQCRSVLAQLYEDVNPTHGYELPNELKALLQIIKVSSTLHIDGHQNRIKGLHEAVLIYPVSECIDCVLKLINNRMTDAHKNEVINVVMNDSLLDEAAENKQYMKRLDCDTTLRSIFKYEKAIHDQNIEPMEKAMLYIDLCMVYGHPVILANNFAMAARELIAHMTESTDAAEVYASKNCVIHLCATVLHFVSTYTNPISQLKYSIHVIRLMKNASQILGDSIEQRGQVPFNSNDNAKPLIGELDEHLLKLANHCVSKSIRVSPLIDITLDMSSDVLYTNTINNKLLEKFYQWNIDTYSDHPLLHLYQYSLMEGAWKCWFDDSEFEEYRRKCIRVMLEKSQMNELDVARTMKLEISNVTPNTPKNDGGLFGSLKQFFFKTECDDKILSQPMIIRSDEGWIVPDENYLNMGKMSFNSVDGLIIDIEQGTFEIIVSTDEQIGPLCDSQDIDEIIIKGLSHSVFSLDQADFELDYHPFQLMRFAPKSLENSRYLSTLLAADYLLKMIATNTEVSAQAPFEIKQATDGFLKALPTDLREFIMMKKPNSDFGKVHRFWIENDNIPCYQNVDDNGKMTFEFYYTSMQIKKHLLKKNSHGELVDDFDDSEDELTDDSEDESGQGKMSQSKQKISPEARFVRRLTQYYDLIGCYFPVLLRLRELAKLSAISMILKNTYNHLEETKKQLTVPRDGINSMLENIKRQITYPICTASMIDELYSNCLRENGLYDDSRVHWSERNRVKDKIRNELKTAERQLLIDVPKLLSESLELENTPALGQSVSDWIVHDERYDLVEYLRSAIYEKKMEKLSKFGNNLKKLGVNLDADDTKLGESDNGCKWVPATFSQLDGRRVYGGVFLRPNVNLQNTRGFQGFQASAGSAGSSAAPSGGSSCPPSGGSGSSGGGSGSKPPSKPTKSKREEILEKYGHGKGWPKTPERVGDTYFGKPGTSFKTHQGIIQTIGPSGWSPVHNIRHSTRKAAIEAAARANRGRGNRKVIVDDAHGKTRMKRGTATDKQKADYLNKNKKGEHSEHVHSTVQKGDKTEKKHDGVHHLF